MKLFYLLLTAISLAGTWDFHFEKGKSIEESAGSDFVADDIMCAGLLGCDAGLLSSTRYSPLSLQFYA